MLKTVFYFFLLLISIISAATSFGLYKLSGIITDPVTDIQYGLDKAKDVVGYLNTFNDVEVDKYLQYYTDSCKNGISTIEYKKEIKELIDSIPGVGTAGKFIDAVRKIPIIGTGLTKKKNLLGNKITIDCPNQK